LKKNRLVDNTGGQEKYKQIKALNWSKTELEQGKIIKIKAFGSSVNNMPKQ
jgi:hydrogenase maturation factor HypF (carbamoyltransferase family)